MNRHVIARAEDEVIPVVIGKVPLWTLCVRVVSEFLIRPLLPRVIIEKNQALKKVHEAAEKGNGLVVVFTHFSLRDAVETNLSIVYKDKVLRNKEVINPLAYHQYNKTMELLGKIFHGTFVPVVNSSTINKKGYGHLPKGKGLSEFIERSSNTLTNGGVVSLAVNATRSEKLDIDDPQKPIGYLIASLQAKGVKNYGLLLVSFAVKNAGGYTKKEVGGLNFGKTYIINISNYYPVEELLNNPEVSGKAGSVDRFVRLELAKLSPKQYLQP